MNIYSYIQMREMETMEERINIENCNCSIIHEDVINTVKEAYPPRGNTL